MTAIRVLIADDHPVVREGLRALLYVQPDMEVVAEAADGLEAVQRTRELRPDVILLDLLMPHMDGLAAIGEIRRELPDACILVLTSYAEDDKIARAIKAGALGYLLKDSSPYELLAAIRAVAHGEASLPPAIARKLISEFTRQPASASGSEDALSERELEVLGLLAKGLSNQEIAKALVISERTVHTHVSRILRKLHLSSRTQAALYALREGLTQQVCP